LTSRRQVPDLGFGRALVDGRGDARQDELDARDEQAVGVDRTQVAQGATRRGTLASNWHAQCGPGLAGMVLMYHHSNSRRPILMPPPGRNDCGSGGRRGTIPYHTIPLQQHSAAAAAEARVASLQAQSAAITAATPAATRLAAESAGEPAAEPIAEPRPCVLSLRVRWRPCSARCSVQSGQ
jgi:hypothetical protein